MSTVVPSERPTAVRISFVGGGSGGHLCPAIAIAQELLRQNSDCRFLFLTSDRAVDQRILATSGLTDAEAQVEAYAAFSSRRGLWGSVLRLPSLWQSMRQARRALKSFRPNVVVGLGALASGPGVLAASRLGLPVMLLEQNCLPGKATRTLARLSRLTVFGLPVSKVQLDRWPSPVQACGTPVRVGIRELARVSPTATHERKRILILGGSQGSYSVNQIVVATFASGLQIPQDWTIVHQTGETQVAEIQGHYQRLGIAARVESFLPDMRGELAAAGIAISRAGAVTIQELACAGVASVLVPLSTAADNHQMINAHLLENDAAIVIDETRLDAVNTLGRAMKLLLSESGLRQRMACAIRSFATPDAATEIVSLLRELST